MNSLQLTFSSMAVSIGIAMDNASTNQHNCQNIANTAMASCCKMILMQQPAPKG
ncbi:MAG: RebB family R body protein [Bacteroidetes bacterium]|nr:RebB family R body protein [Bacteroidota bacterium]